MFIHASFGRHSLAATVKRLLLDDVVRGDDERVMSGLDWYWVAAEHTVWKFGCYKRCLPRWHSNVRVSWGKRGFAQRLTITHSTLLRLGYTRTGEYENNCMSTRVGSEQRVLRLLLLKALIWLLTIVGRLV